MKRYRITERATGDSASIQAESAQEACCQLGWMIGHCYVVELPGPEIDYIFEGRTVECSGMGEFLDMCIPPSPPEQHEPPSMEQLQRWHAEGGCEATDGCWVEPDGYCEHGCPSWLLKLGLI